MMKREILKKELTCTDKATKHVKPKLSEDVSTRGHAAQGAGRPRRRAGAGSRESEGRVYGDFNPGTRRHEVGTRSRKPHEVAARVSGPSGGRCAMRAAVAGVPC